MNNDYERGMRNVFAQTAVPDTTKTGGSAFPSSGGAGTVQAFGSMGMTLRDYFAAKAMAGYLSAGGQISDQAAKNPAALAAWAYENADAMLAERKK